MLLLLKQFTNPSIIKNTSRAGYACIHNSPNARFYDKDNKREPKIYLSNEKL